MRTKLAKRYMAILRGPLTVEWAPTFYQFISMFHAVRNIVKPVLPPKMLTCCSNHNRRNMLGKKTTSETVGVAPKPLNRSTRTHSGARYKNGQFEICRPYHGPPFLLRRGHGALWSIRFKQAGSAGLSGCLDIPLVKGTIAGVELHVVQTTTAHRASTHNTQRQDGCMVLAMVT